jgi:hypothetical protein
VVPRINDATDSDNTTSASCKFEDCMIEIADKKAGAPPGGN